MSDNTRTDSFSFGRADTESGYYMGQKEMNSSGYEVYNIHEEDQVYIAKVPETVMFNDGDPVFRKADPGVFVGLSRTRTALDIEEDVPVVRRSVEDMFAGVKRGGQHEVKAKVGVCRDGKIESPTASTVTTNAAIQSNRMDDIHAAAFGMTGNMAMTGSGKSGIDIKVDNAHGYNTDNVTFKSEGPRATGKQSKFVFRNGKLVEL